MDVSAVSTIINNTQYNDQSQLSYLSCDLLPGDKVCQAIKNGSQTLQIFIYFVIYFAENMVQNIFPYDKNTRRVPHVRRNVWFETSCGNSIVTDIYN